MVAAHAAVRPSCEILMHPRELLDTAVEGTKIVHRSITGPCDPFDRYFVRFEHTVVRLVSVHFQEYFSSLELWFNLQAAESYPQR